MLAIADFYVDTGVVGFQCTVFDELFRSTA
jgi:hypothetical protein